MQVSLFFVIFLQVLHVLLPYSIPINAFYIILYQNNSFSIVLCPHRPYPFLFFDFLYPSLFINVNIVFLSVLRINY